MELNENKIVIYQTSEGNTSIEVKLENETVWLSVNQMAVLFDRDEKTIRKHVYNVFAEGELTKENNTHFLRVADSDKPVAFYTLDVIISVGYRMKDIAKIQRFARFVRSEEKRGHVPSYKKQKRQVRLGRCLFVFISSEVYAQPLSMP